MAEARRPSRLASAGLLALALATVSCDIPRDPEGTLKHVEGGTMQVGITDNEPWAAFADGEASGVEVEILERFSEELDAEIEWIPGTEEDLMTALEQREVDVVIGGLTSTNPWSAKVAFTHPYLTTSVVVAIPSGADIPEDIAGLRVAVERGTEAAGILEKTDAEVVYEADIAEAVEASGPGGTSPVVINAYAIDNWLLDELSLEDTDVTLIETDHVMAMPMGENAWLVRLERYLLTHEDDIKALLEEKGKP